MFVNQRKSSVLHMYIYICLAAMYMFVCVYMYKYVCVYMHDVYTYIRLILTSHHFVHYIAMEKCHWCYIVNVLVFMSPQYQIPPLTPSAAVRHSSFGQSGGCEGIAALPVTCCIVGLVHRSPHPVPAPRENCQAGNICPADPLSSVEDLFFEDMLTCVLAWRLTFLLKRGSYSPIILLELPRFCDEYFFSFWRDICEVCPMVLLHWKDLSPESS